MATETAIPAAAPFARFGARPGFYTVGEAKAIHAEIRRRFPGRTFDHAVDGRAASADEAELVSTPTSN